MTISALLMSLALVSPQAQTVNYETSGTNVANVLAAASQGWEKPLECSPELSQEIVVVRAKDMPVQQFMDEMAFVTGGKWNDVGVKVILNLDTDAVKRYEQEKLQKRAAALAKARESKRKERAEMFKDWTEEDKKGMAEDADFQMSWMLEDLILRVPDQTILQMKPGDRVVYSSSPNRMQRAMPAVNWNVFAPLIVKAANDRFQMYEEMMKEDPDENYMSMLPPNLVEMLKPKKFEGQPSLALLIHETPKKSDEISGFGQFTFVVFDSAGNNRFSVNTNLGSGGYDYLEMAFDDEGHPIEKPEKERETRPKPYPDKDVDSEKVAPSETQLKLNKFRTSLTDFNVETVDEEIRAIMRDVDRHEPLGWSVGEQLLKAAEMRGENLISLVADDEFGFSYYQESSRETVNSIIGSQFNDDLESPQTLWYRNNTLIARPGDIHDARKLRVNRTALATLLRSIETRTVPDVDLVANYFASNENAFDSDFSQTMLLSVAPQYSEMGELFGNMSFMPIYAFLAQGQRDALKRGERLPFASIGGVARTKLTEMLFGANPNLTVMNPNDPIKNPIDRMMEQSFGMIGSMGGGMFGGGGPAAAKTEPTLVMPNGLPGQGGIVSQAVREGYLVQVDKNGKPVPMSIPMGAMEVSMFSMFLDMASQEGEDTGDLPTFDRMLYGQQTRADIRIYVAEDVVMPHTFQWLDEPQKGTFYSMKNPPAEMQGAIRAMSEQMKKSAFFQMMSMGMSRGRETAPPPPPSN
ncbi:MAG: hypothetical protein KDC26_02040 [Armatimonadetes bacterium]|nr:hypothetical protein [Armatimonadota bacterium]